MSEIYDRQMALEQAGGSAALLAELIEVFAKETPALLAQLREAIDQGDAAEVQRIAHTIKGSARVFGAEAVATVAERLEAMGREAELNEADEAMKALDVQAERLLTALSAEVADAT